LRLIRRVICAGQIHSEQFGMTSRKELLILALLCLLVLLPFWKLAIGQGVVITNDVGVSDIANLQYPLRFFAGQEWRQGRVPLWTPGVYMGYPLQAEGQAGVFSPANVLLAGLLPVPDALNIGSLLPFLVAAVGAYLLTRELGASVAGAFLAGFVYSFSGFYIAHVKHIPIVTTACWIPVVLWLVERGVRGSHGALLSAGLVMGVQWLSGSPQMAYYSTVIATAYFAARAWQGRGEQSLRRTVPLYAAALILSWGLGAVQLLPTFQLTTFSERSGGVSYDFATRFSYALENLKTWIYPMANGTPGTGDLAVSSIFWEDYAYVGLVPLFLGLLGGLVLAWRSGTARLLLGLLAITFFLVLGPNTPLFRIAYQALPGLGFFRFPQRFLAFVTLFLAVLAGLALTSLQGWLKRESRAGRTTKGRQTRASAQGRRASVRDRFSRATLAHVVIGVLLVVVAVDLYSYHVPWNAIVDRDVWLTPPETAQVMEERAGGDMYRVFSYDVYNTFRAAYRQAGGWRGDLGPYVDQREFLQPSLNLIYDVPTADGYINLVPDCLAAVWGTEKQRGVMDSGLVLADDTLLAKREFVKMLGMHNVRFLITSQPVQDPALELIGVYGPGAYLYENLKTKPRAYAVPGYTVADNISAALDQMSSPSFDPDTEVILLEQPDVRQEESEATVSGQPENFDATVQLTDFEPNRVVIEADLNSAGWLVLNDSYYTGWDAAVDGQKTPIYEANGCVRAVPLKAGQHEVVFQYRPRPLLLGGAVSAISVVVFVVVGVVIWRKKDADFRT
jgi:hypothetical protein